MEQPRGLFTDEVYTARVVDIVYVMPADAFQSVFLLEFGEKQIKSKIQGTVKKLVTDLLNSQVTYIRIWYWKPSSCIRVPSYVPFHCLAHISILLQTTG